MKPRCLWRVSSCLALLLTFTLAFGVSGCRKKKKAAPKPKAAAVATPFPEEALGTPAPSPHPAATPAITPAPNSTPHPQATPGLPPSSPVPQVATPFPGVGLPQAESSQLESQPSGGLLNIGAPIKTAEGTTLVLDQVQWNGTATVGNKFLWTLVSGPADKIHIEKASDLKPRVTIGNLEEPAEWLLHLQASDGRNNAGGDLKINAFPARLQAKQRVGGVWVGIKRMGDKWVAARGDEVEIFNPDFSPLTKFKTGRVITQILARVDAQGKGAIYVQAPEGNWAVFQSDPVEGFKKSEFPQLGRSVRRLFPFESEGMPYVFALLERNIELWSFPDPSHPRLKTSLGATFLKNPLFVAVAQRTIYVAEEDQIHLIEFSTGNLIASVPSGGSVTGLATYSVDGKDQLLVAIGKDRTTQGRKDYGVRIFEILPGGRLGSEQRLTLSDHASIDRVQVIPEAAKALLIAGEPGNLSLRMIDLKQKAEILLQGEAAKNFLIGNEISTGRIGDQSVAAISDANQLRVLSFKPVNDTTYSASSFKNLASIASAAWVRSRPDGSQIWVGDEGTQSGGALVEIGGPDFKIGGAWNAPAGSFPAHADFRTGGPLNPILYLTSELASLQKANAEGLLGLEEEKGDTGPDLSKPTYGNFSPQGLVRGAGIAGRNLESGLRIVTALSRFSGTAGNPGIAILDKPAAQNAKAFLAEDLIKMVTIVPLQDARDVALSSDGKAAFVAAGTYGVVAVDLEKKAAVARMSLGSEAWIADRVILGQSGQTLLALFVNRSNRQVLLKIFGVNPNYQMQEYGNLPGLPAVNTLEGWRAPRPALTDDELYLFVPTQARTLGVFNLSNPAAPAKIAEVEVEGDIRGVSLANRFKDVFLALGAAGISKLEFGF